MSDGFLSRWSRRKTASTGKAGDSTGNVPGEDQVATQTTAATIGPAVQFAQSSASQPWAGMDPAIVKLAEQRQSASSAQPGARPAPASLATKAVAQTNESTLLESTPLPSLESLSFSSDYKPFMQAGVASESRNAALKKLFTDPSFNVMDGLDTYIADYSKPDPIPLEMLKGLIQSKTLRLFEEEEKEEAEKDETEQKDANHAEAKNLADLGDASLAQSQPTQSEESPGPRIAPQPTQAVSKEPPKTIEASGQEVTSPVPVTHQSKPAAE